MSKSLLSIGKRAYDILCLINYKSLKEIRKELNISSQDLQCFIRQLLNSDSIVKFCRGSYKTTTFGDYLIKYLRVRRDNSLNGTKAN